MVRMDTLALFQILGGDGQSFTSKCDDGMYGFLLSSL